MNKLHGGLAGHTAWEIFNPDGVVVASGERHNLITDAGMDAFATENGRAVSADTLMYVGFRSMVRVGTGSGAPTTAKVALTNQVAYGSATGGFSAEQSDTAAVVGNTLVGTHKMVRVINFTGAYNLTEYGLGNSNVGNLSITELFRDAQGNPIAVSVQNGYQLKLTHTLTITLPYVATAGNINLGSGNIPTQQTFFAIAGGQLNAISYFAPTAGGDIYILTAADTGAPSTVAANAAVNSTRTQQAYVAGSYQRTYRYEIAPADGVRDHYGWVLGSYYVQSGYKVALQGGNKVTKTNTQKLTLDYTVSWGRQP